ncbi:hypothetical protein ACFULT_25570 [Rhodococcus sp. NPDC057297]|uniref:hypothetical protein n=1 Tax=Rhodococcus sp. NPDC057297 TaxID=3346090 RepID=UPI003633548C
MSPGKEGLNYGQREDRGASEFGYGSGLTPPGLEGAPPRLGGRYRAKPPRPPTDPALVQLQRELDGEDD